MIDFLPASRFPFTHFPDIEPKRLLKNAAISCTKKMILCNYLQGCNNFLPCIWAEVGASGGTIRPPSLILPHPNTYLAALGPPYAAIDTPIQ